MITANIILDIIQSILILVALGLSLLRWKKLRKIEGRMGTLEKRSFKYLAKLSEMNDDLGEALNHAVKELRKRKSTPRRK